MSQAEAYLNSLTEDTSQHSHTVIDSDSHFVIDPETRKISSAGQTENILIQYDHNSEVYTFELPRYIDGHDMSLCNRVRVHYNNVDGKTKRAIPDVAEMTDLHVSETDPDKVVSSWLITRNATQLAGTLNFLIQYMCVDDDNVVYEWHTDIYDGVYVNSGRRNNKQVVARYSDVLEQWYQQLFGTGESVIALAEDKIKAINEVSSSNIADINAAANSKINFAKEEIESKASATLDTIPSEYTELYNYANEAARTKGDAVTHTIEGEVLSVDDSSDDYLRGLRVFGKTTQLTTTGKNLLPYPYASTSKTVSGVEFTVFDDGTIKVNGKASEEIYYWLKNGTEVEPGNYMLSGYASGTSSTAFLYLIVNKSDGAKEYYSDKGQGAAFTVASGDTLGIAIVVKKDVSLTNAVFTPMIELGSTATAYEPYSGGVASPSPEWSQELVSVENPVVDVYGKNLLKHTVSPGSHTIKGITFTVRDDGSVVCNGTATAPATLSFERCYFTEDIIVSGCPAGGDTQTYRITVDAYKNDSYVRSEFDLGNSVTICKASYDYVNINIFFYAGTVADNMVFYPMVRHASITDATYEPYNGGSVTISHTLPGIPVDQNGNYTDENGQQWICDEADFERGVYVQRVGIKTIDGSTKPTTFAVGNNGGTVLGWQYDGIGMANIVRDRSPKLCDKLLAPDVFEPASYKNCEYGRWGFNTKASIDSFLLINVGTFATADEAKQWFVENPVTFYYVLATPIETPLTETELQTFKYLHSNYPSTTVFNDSGVHMELKYNVDTELFIKNTVPSPTDQQVNDIVMPWFEDNRDLLRGPQGPKGDTGATGARGPQGPKGADGTVTFTDLTQEQKDSLKGDIGEQGPKGEKGDPGMYIGTDKPTDESVNVWIKSDGEPGKIQYGKSAYEYAKDGGFTGTEEEFTAKMAAEYATPSDVNDAKTAAVNDSKTYTNEQVAKAPPRNLLDNSYWENPDAVVNQRNSVYITSKAGYPIDRWQYAYDGDTAIGGAGYDATRKYLYLINDASSSGNTMLYHKIPMDKLTPGKYTFAIKQKGTKVSVPILAYINGAILNSATVDPNADDISLMTFEITEVKTYLTLYIYAGANKTLAFSWAALYPGEYTSDTLPEYRSKGYGAELIECMQYYCRNWDGNINASDAVIFASPYPKRSTATVFPIPMRGVPTVSVYNPFTGSVGCVGDWVTDADVGVSPVYLSTHHFILGGDGIAKGETYSYVYEASVDIL